MNVTARSTAEFTRCTFEDFHADFYGQAVFSSIAQFRLADSHLATTRNSTVLLPGTVFDFGVSSDCRSGCPAGMFGACVAVDSCYSCKIGSCTHCPVGSFRATPGAVSISQCLPCPQGTYNGEEGAAGCNECAVGSYVTLNTSGAADGFGTNSGGDACVSCPAGRETTTSGSVRCSACSAGESSDVGAACLSW